MTQYWLRPDYKAPAFEELPEATQRLIRWMRRRYPKTAARAARERAEWERVDVEDAIEAMRRRWADFNQETARQDAEDLWRNR